MTKAAELRVLASTLDDGQTWEVGNRLLDLKLADTPASGDVGVQFRAGSGDWLGFAASGTDVGLVIDTSNRVGIGEMYPDKKLEVNVTSNDDGIFLLSNGTVIGSLARETVGSTVVTSIDGVTGRDIHVGGRVNTDVILGYAGGNVGVGELEPAYQLHVAGAGDIKIEDTSGGSAHLRLGASTSGTRDSEWKVKVSGSLDEFHIDHDYTTGGTSGGGNVFKISGQTHSLYNNNNQPRVSPVINLDFANSKTLDNRMTFSRDGLGSYYDARGILRYASINEPRFDHDPVTGQCKGLLIEEYRENGLSSDVFDPGIANSPGVIQYQAQAYPHAAKSPDGTYNAWSLQNKVSGNTYAFLNWGVSAGSTVTFSVYAKAGIGNFNRCVISNRSSNSMAVIFDLTNGNIVDTWADLGTITDAKSEFVGDGWYRLTVTMPSSNQFNVHPAQATHSSAVDFNANTNYTDYGFIYIFGVQREMNPTSSSLIKTDTRFVSRSSKATYHDADGVLRNAENNIPRYGYKYDGRKWVETGLILEDTATNLCTASNNFSAWSLDQGIASVEKDYSVLAPDRTPAWKITNTSGVVEGHFIRFTFTETSNYGYTLSVYAKQGTGRYLVMNLGASRLAGVWDLQDGEVIVQQHNSSYFVNHQAYIENVGGGWWRCSISGQSLNGQGNYIRVGLSDGSSGYQPSYDGNGDYIHIFGASIEQRTDGSLAQPTSYMYTDGSIVTRATDVATSPITRRYPDFAVMRNLSKYFESESGFTSFVHASSDNVPPNNGRYYELTTEADNANNRALAYNNSGIFRWLYRSNLTNDTVFSSNATWSETNKEIKQAVSWSPTQTLAADSYGTTGVDATPGYPNTFDNLYVGSAFDVNTQLNGHVKKIALYDSSFAEAELIALTEND